MSPLVLDEASPVGLSRRSMAGVRPVAAKALLPELCSGDVPLLQFSAPLLKAVLVEGEGGGGEAVEKNRMGSL